MGGLLNSATVGSAVKALLEKDGTRYTWVAATVGSHHADGFQLATQLPVMPIGGFNGTDPSPTLAQFQKYVAQHKIHYFLYSTEMGQTNGGSGVGTQISLWVKAHFKAQVVDGVTIYDLTSPTS